MPLFTLGNFDLFFRPFRKVLRIHLRAPILSIVIQFRRFSLRFLAKTLA